MKRAIALILALAMLACTVVLAEDQERQIVELDAPVQMYVHAIHGLNLRSEMDLDNDDNIQRVLLLNETVMVDYIVDGVWAHVTYVLPASEQVEAELEAEIEAVEAVIESELEESAEVEPAATAEPAAEGDLSENELFAELTEAEGEIETEIVAEIESELEENAEAEPAATTVPATETEAAATEAEENTEAEEETESAEEAGSAEETESAEETVSTEETESAEETESTEEAETVRTIEGYMWLGYLGQKAYRPAPRKAAPAATPAPVVTPDPNETPSEDKNQESDSEELPQE